MDLLKAMRILIPPATQSLEYKDTDLAAFYEYYALNTRAVGRARRRSSPVDGRYAACTLDRNGLRPARWQLTEDRHFLIASEAGVWDVPARTRVRKGKLGPGEMIAVDLRDGVPARQRGDRRDQPRARARTSAGCEQGMTYLHTELIDPALADAPFDR